MLQTVTRQIKWNQRPGGTLEQCRAVGQLRDCNTAGWIFRVRNTPHIARTLRTTVVTHSADVLTSTIQNLTRVSRAWKFFFFTTARQLE